MQIRTYINWLFIWVKKKYKMAKIINFIKKNTLMIYERKHFLVYRRKARRTYRAILVYIIYYII